jgi:hypothetical protein
MVVSSIGHDDDPLVIAHDVHHRSSCPPFVHLVASGMADLSGDDTRQLLVPSWGIVVRIGIAEWIGKGDVPSNRSI